MTPDLILWQMSSEDVCSPDYSVTAEGWVRFDRNKPGQDAHRDGWVFLSMFQISAILISLQPKQDGKKNGCLESRKNMCRALKQPPCLRDLALQMWNQILYKPQIMFFFPLMLINRLAPDYVLFHMSLLFVCAVFLTAHLSLTSATSCGWGDSLLVLLPHILQVTLEHTVKATQVPVAQFSYISEWNPRLQSQDLF